MFGHMSLNVVACPETFANPKQMEFIQHSVQLYKEFIRPFLPKCKIYHATPNVKEALKQGYSLLEITAEDKTRGIFGAFTLSNGGRKEIKATLRGVDTSKTYKVTFDNLGHTCVLSGAELYMNGITVTVPASMSSELITYEAIQASKKAYTAK